MLAAELEVGLKVGAKARLGRGRSDLGTLDLLFQAAQALTQHVPRQGILAGIVAIEARLRSACALGDGPRGGALDSSLDEERQRRFRDRDMLGRFRSSA